jgi:hypothetical protein
VQGGALRLGKVLPRVAIPYEPAIEHRRCRQVRAAGQTLLLYSARMSPATRAPQHNMTHECAIWLHRGELSVCKLGLSPSQVSPEQSLSKGGLNIGIRSACNSAPYATVASDHSHASMAGAMAHSRDLDSSTTSRLDRK